MGAPGWLRNADGMLRAPWRVALFLAACFVGVVLALNLVVPLVSGALRPFGVGLDQSSWAVMLGLLAAHAAMLAWCDPRPWSYVAMGAAAARPGRLARGFVVGALAIGLPMAALAAGRWLTRTPASPGSWLAASLRLGWFLLPAALWEELLFRGYLFAVLREAWGPAAALGTTSVLFGLVHLSNPGAGLGPIALVMLAGVFLGAVLVVLRSLYAAWLAHFAWNWTMAALFHTAVSGVPLEMPNYRFVDSGPDWATGGPWGPEGGAAGGLGMVGGIAYLFARRRRTAASRPDQTLES